MSASNPTESFGDQITVSEVWDFDDDEKLALVGYIYQCGKCGHFGEVTTSVNAYSWASTHEAKCPKRNRF
jgi:hypothetical protein